MPLIPVQDPHVRPLTHRMANSGRMVRAIAAVAALAAAMAPVSLTGYAAIDAVERALLAGVVTFVAARGHRWSWLVAAGILAIPARGVSLVLVFLALGVALWTTVAKRRPKAAGAVIAGLLANAPLWYQDVEPSGLGALCGIVGLTILLASGLGEVRSRHRRIVWVPILGAVAVAVVALLGTAWAGIRSSGDLQAGTSSARSALTAVQNGDSESARTSLEKARHHLERAQDQLGVATTPARLVPGLAQQVDTVKVAIDEAAKIANAADDLLASADYDELRYNGQLDLVRVSELGPRARNIHEVLSRAEQRLDAASTHSLLPPLRTRLEEFRGEVADARDDSDLAADLLDLAPDLFGATSPRYYLVAFLTNAELRGAGGFVGSYAELEAVNGEVELTRSGPIRDLILGAPTGTRSLEGPEDYLRRYGRHRPADYLQDVSLSPDWPAVADVLSQLYPQSGGRKVDGVIGVDPIGLAGLLELTGPVNVEGLDRPLTADNAADVLLREQYLAFDADKAERKDVLAEATRATFKKLTASSLPAPRKLGDVLGPVTRGRHIQVWSPTPAEQAVFEKVGIDSRLHIPEGDDGFTIVQQNVGNNKIDAYLHRSFTYEASVNAETGNMVGRLKIVLRNDVPSVDLPPDVVANSRAAPVGTNLASLSIHTHHVVTGATLDGKKIDLGEDREAGMLVWDTPTLQIPPGGQITLVIQLSGGLDLTDGYQLSILPQPVANPDTLDVSVRARSGRLEGPTVVGGRLRRTGALEETVQLEAEVER